MLKQKLGHLSEGEKGDSGEAQAPRGVGGCDQEERKQPRHTAFHPLHPAPTETHLAFLPLRLWVSFLHIRGVCFEVSYVFRSHLGLLLGFLGDFQAQNYE